MFWEVAWCLNNLVMTLKVKWTAYVRWLKSFNYVRFLFIISPGSLDTDQVWLHLLPRSALRLPHRPHDLLHPLHLHPPQDPAHRLRLAGGPSLHLRKSGLVLSSLWAFRSVFFTTVLWAQQERRPVDLDSWARSLQSAGGSPVFQLP